MNRGRNTYRESIDKKEKGKGKQSEDEQKGTEMKRREMKKCYSNIK